MIDFFDINTYDYILPEELIAQYPLDQRSKSKLLCLSRDNGSIHHKQFEDICELIKPSDLIVVNNSKVFPARLFGTKANGTRIEVLLLHNYEGILWKCMVHPGKRLKEPQWLSFSENLRGYIGYPDDEGFRNIEMHCSTDLFQELDAIGHVPLPPYIHRQDTVKDKTTYQTVYASQIGSVAAPTAGLHFDHEIWSKLQGQGTLILELMLHVGVGTFLPVKKDNIRDHKMHSEFCSITPHTASTINKAKLEGRRIIAVGTTSVRTLESFYNPETMLLESGSKWTDIFLYPGKSFHVVDALITNFHLPKSTLLMLVSAFAGYETIKRAYQEAITAKYRFFSYGDAMFIHPGCLDAKE